MPYPLQAHLALETSAPGSSCIGNKPWLQAHLALEKTYCCSCATVAVFFDVPVQAISEITYFGRYCMIRAKQVAAVLTFLLLGGCMFAAYARNQGRLGKIHYQDCKITPEHIPASIHGDIVFWAFDGNVGATDSVEIRFDKPEGSPCTNPGPILVSASGSGYCMINPTTPPPKRYNYSVWKNGEKCNDPSVDVQNGR
jgi:hypothetical protein